MLTIEERRRPSWTFLTSHAHVLMCIAEDPGIRIRDIASRAGISERATQRVVADLERAGYLSHARVGRRNRYSVNRAIEPTHPLEERVDVASLLRPTRSD